MKSLIEEMTPEMAAKFQPCLPAHILFMCIRNADILNDDERVKLLLNSSIQAVKNIVKVCLTIKVFIKLKYLFTKT